MLATLIDKLVGATLVVLNFLAPVEVKVMPPATPAISHDAPRSPTSQHRVPRL